MEATKATIKTGTAAQTPAAQKSGKMELNVENVKKLHAEKKTRSEMMEIFGLGKSVYPLRVVLKEAGLINPRRAPDFEEMYDVMEAVRAGCKDVKEIASMNGMDEKLVKSAVRKLTAMGKIAQSYVVIPKKTE